MKILRNTALVAVLRLMTGQANGQSGLAKGTIAPSFTGKDNKGNIIELKQLLKTNRAVVLFFYRGQWCPYCNKYTTHLQDSLQMLAEKGFYVVAVTPETGENIHKTVEKTGASFSIIRDADYRIMKDYDVIYTVEGTTVARLLQYGIDLDKANGNNDRKLPVPATYVIDKEGKISYVHFNKDYTQRASVRSILEQ